MPAPTMTPGVRLRQARLAGGETIRLATERVGLPIRYTAALERDLPYLVFRRQAMAEAFLRVYAGSLGLDPDREVAVFRVHARTVGWTHNPARAGAAGTPTSARSLRPAPDGRREPATRSRSLGPALRRPIPRRPARAALYAVGGVALVMAVVAVNLGFGPPPLGTGPRDSDRTSRTPPSPGAGTEGLAGSLAPGTMASPADPASPSVAAPAVRVLPGGGTSIVPDRRVVALYGSPVSRLLGRLGAAGTPQEAAAEVAERARSFEGPTRRPVIPALHLIAVIATRSGGSDGLHRARLDPAEIQRYLDAARSIDGLLILDIQAGRSDFLTEARRLEPFLRQPDVGLALDPEWRVGPGQVPGDVVGTVDASEVNEVVRFVAALVQEHDLPQKLLVLHQFKDTMITNRNAIETPPGLAVVLDIDGRGPRSPKVRSYVSLTAGAEGLWPGIKLYTNSEPDMLRPEDILNLTPRPVMVIYQ